MSALPEAFMTEIREMLGDEAPAFFDCMDESAALALRVNPQKSAARQAALPFIESMVPWADNGYYILPDTRPGAGIAHAAGAFYMQEASAMVSVSALAPKKGERILDLCAAPGGKSTQIAAAMDGEGLLICNEPEPGRAKVLASNLERMGVRNAAAVNAYPDALSARWSGYFDAVLCDAPCSGEGMFRRDIASRDQWNPASPAGCAKRQAEILDEAAKLVRPGGRLVYSTCTFNRAENEGSINAFLDRHSEFTAEEFTLNGIGDSENGMLRVWPQRVRGDGHFCARLRKSGDDRMDAPSFRISREDAALLSQLNREVCRLSESLSARLNRAGDYLYAIPRECPDMKGLRVVKAGLCLLRAGRNYIEPEHALAIAIDPESALRRAELTDAEAAAYLSGEAIPFDGDKGWTLAIWNSLALGWGKISGGLLKNHLPKGLRLNNVLI